MANENLLYSDVFKRGNKVYVRAIDQVTGERVRFQEEFKPFLYMKTNNVAAAVARSLRDEPLERMDFDTINEFEDFQERYKDTEGFKMYGCRDVAYQYIANNYPGKIKHVFKHVRGAILDIEVESGDIEVDASGKIVNMTRGPFPEPEDANYPVTAVTVYDTKTKAFITLGLEVFKGVRLGTYVHDKTQPKTGGLKVVYKGFDDERALLIALVNLMSGIEPDFISGWNSDTFDVVYIINRVKKILGDDWAKKFSPWNIIRQRTFTGSFGKDTVEYEIYGVTLLDFKALVEKHGYVELENKKLNTAAKHYLNEEKLNYDEAKSLTTLYFTNYQKYIQYNIQDVNLVVRMEAVNKFFELVYVLAYLCHCNPQDTMGTVQPWSAMLYAKLHARGQEPELKSPYQGDTQYLGAFVQEPKPGRYKWGVSIDANALYPHMAMQFNMGPETILSDREAYDVRMALVKELDQELPTPYIRQLKEHIRQGALINEFYWEEAYEFKTLKKLGLTMTPNCAFFRLDKQSILSETFEELYAERKVVKKEMLKHEQELVDLKGLDAYEEAAVEILEGLIASKHNVQWGIKIVANGGYGAIANRWLREYFDIRIAEGITSGGQVGLRYTMKKMNDYFNAKLGTTGENFIITGDTDSIYMCLDPYISKVCAGMTDVETIDFMDKMFTEEIEPKLLEWAKELSNALNCYAPKLVFKRETLFNVGIFTAKKRYALMVADSEGVRYKEPKLKYVGLEAKKSDYPAFCRNWLKECYKLALTQPESAIHEKVQAVKAEFMSFPVHQIAAPRSINNLEKYLDDPIKGTWLPKCPPQLKAAINHNRIIYAKKLDEKLIVSGDKILMVPLKKGAPHGMEVFGFPEFLSPEFGMDQWVDKSASFNKYFVDPLNNFLVAIKWSHEPQASVMNFFV
jgi:DNA polymerase elongation subunit (family B)